MKQLLAALAAVLALAAAAGLTGDIEAVKVLAAAIIACAAATVAP